jgi:hypothetical protein
MGREDNSEDTKENEIIAGDLSLRSDLHRVAR